MNFFLFLLRIFFFFFFYPFLVDGGGGSSDVGGVRDTAGLGPTAPRSLKSPGPEYLVCSRSTGGSADFTFHYLMALRFDSLLPVSVKAELNVNQGPGREEHECKQIEPRAAQVGGTLSTERKGKERKGKERKESAVQSFPGPEAPCTPRSVRSAATSNIHGNGLTIYHSSSSQIVLSLFKVSNLSLRLNRLPCPSFFFFFELPRSCLFLKQCNIC